ncbi:MAG: hypothetical protein Q8Q52_00265 [Acidimicrobiia bacterium]|nr:hypothetical protein [Acidimicrobiia bacterium]
MGPAERALRACVRPGQILRTRARSARFEIGAITSKSLTLRLGQGRWATPLTWECLEGVVPFVRQRGGSVEIGSRFDTGSKPGTLDSYLKPFINRATGPWVAAVFVEAGLLEFVDKRPLAVRVPR